MCGLSTRDSIQFHGLAMSNTLIFDFDGVLCDSIEECMVVSFNAYWENTHIDTKLITNPLREYFYKYRYLVRPAGEYFVIWESYYKNNAFKNRSYDDMLNDCSFQVSLFQDKFFKYRENLKKDYDMWISLHKPYPNILKFLIRNDGSIFILTNKDRDSVEKISTAHGYRDKIAAIYSKEISSDKYFLIKQLVEDHNYINETDHIYYLDDNISNLRDVSRIDMPNLICLLAQWGYCGETPNNPYNEIKDIIELEEIISNNY